MIKGNIATLTESKSTILAGETFFVQTEKLADGQTDLKAGTVLLRQNDPTSDEPLVALTTVSVATIPYGVLMEDIDGTTENTLANVVVFGKVKESKLLPADQITAPVKYMLRMAGIYAVQGE